MTLALLEDFLRSPQLGAAREEFLVESPYLTLSEAAAYARTSTRTIQRRLKAGDLKRYGSSRPLILKTELEALLTTPQAEKLEAES